MSLQQVWSELAPYWPPAAAPVTPGSTSTAIAPPAGASECFLVAMLQPSFLLQMRNIEVHLRVPRRVTGGA